MPYKNPIRNLIVAISERDLRICNRCGCPNLAWVRFKSGKWGLVHTTTSRPCYRGENANPTGLWAVKNIFHNCDEYRKKLAAIAEEQRLAQRAVEYERPSDMLAGAVTYLYDMYPTEFRDTSSGIFAAVRIFALAATQVKNPQKVQAA